MRERQLRTIKRGFLIVLTTINALIVPILVKSSIETTLIDTQGVFNNYLTRVNFTIIFIILLGLINLVLVLIGFFLDEFSLFKLLLSIFNALLSVFSIILWSALLEIEILMEDNYISLDMSGAFLILIILPLLYLLRNISMFRIRRELLWYYIKILNVINNDDMRNFHQLKRRIVNSVVDSRKDFLLRTFDDLIENLYESENPMIKKQYSALLLTNKGAELLYKYQKVTQKYSQSVRKK